MGVRQKSRYAGLPAHSGLRGKNTASHAAGYGLYDRYWASAGVINIDTTVISPASVTIFLPIPVFLRPRRPEYPTIHKPARFQARCGTTAAVALSVDR